ncbi:hypothetical protein B0T17DRAFT_514899 [Bombardia bombarda]|uniref:DUF7514 domain-containing protein n=1 Tax=Bombardia bombarda TaxID=252184 RepID=A0AA40CE69_9PEZI|nr:hypothetical protein B0T17DRAFT_514899 [Bombardia bombarda]
MDYLGDGWSSTEAGPSKTFSGKIHEILHSHGSDNSDDHGKNNNNTDSSDLDNRRKKRSGKKPEQPPRFIPQTSDREGQKHGARAHSKIRRPKRDRVRWSDDVLVRPRSSSPEEVFVRSGSPSPEPYRPIDKKWGVLFDEDGEPTRRVGQVLEGVAKCIIAADESTSDSRPMTITPGMMRGFYFRYNVVDEEFDFASLFSTRGPDNSNDTTNYRLSEVYHTLGCEYYLIPATAGARPSVPALTARGWAQWAIIAIRASPDKEAARLAKVVAALPVEAESLLDGTGRLERMPKGISRHLLPATGDWGARGLLHMVMTKLFQDQAAAAAAAAAEASFANNSPSAPHVYPVRSAQTNVAAGGGGVQGGYGYQGQGQGQQQVYGRHPLQMGQGARPPSPQPYPQYSYSASSVGYTPAPNPRSNASGLPARGAAGMGQAGWQEQQQPWQGYGWYPYPY